MSAGQTALPIEKKTYTPREAARILGVSHQTVTRMVHEGKLLWADHARATGMVRS